MNFELVSFNICPYVQRAVITLKHRGVPFKLTDIDLTSPPEWFQKISPMGKVPVLRVTEAGGDAAGAETILFESAVINEFLDEVVPGQRMLPIDPLSRARAKGWIEFGSELMGAWYSISTATDAAEQKAALDELFADLVRVEPVISEEGPWFLGSQPSLVDSTWAPLFFRMSLFEQSWKRPEWKQLPRTRRWAEACMTWPALTASVVPGFREKTKTYLKARGALWGN